MTEKLYYKDAYIKEFSANIISINECERGYDTVLDRTAFFPEEGGQSADGGKISGIEVLDVYEEDGVVHHILKSRPEISHVQCELDFNTRFEKMQLHTAEHILCGIIHRLFGLENVGFHLGTDEVTFDISGVLTREELDRVEDFANEAVFANIRVDVSFPTSEEAQKISYRSKLDLKENIRLVKIGEVDTCACCAPHVAYTGEIGMIKILDFAKHKGGLRIIMSAGRRAVADYRIKYANLRRISALLSEPQHTTADALEKYVADTEALRTAHKQIKIKLAEVKAKGISESEGNALYLLDGFGYDELRAFANIAVKRVGGILLALSDCGEGYSYVIASEKENLSVLIKEANAKLSGRGGGRPNMVQGSFTASLSEIASYFDTDIITL
ncbi:MAG: hypothetical protein J6C09_07535 [Clostridia bacterium]|nr:hypothetical protein [Clostridia bacterium]